MSEQLQNSKDQQLQATQKKYLRSLAGDKELQQTLVYGALMYGLKPDKIEIDIATRFTKKNYPTLTLENVLEAFELNTTGKNWTLVEPYGNFSNLFIGKVLTAYELWLRSKTLREIKALPEPVKNGTGNFTSNIATLLSIPNHLLQGELRSAGHATGSFLVNSTIGILGTLHLKYLQLT